MIHQNSHSQNALPAAGASTLYSHPPQHNASVPQHTFQQHHQQTSPAKAQAGARIVHSPPPSPHSAINQSDAHVNLHQPPYPDAKFPSPAPMVNFKGHHSIDNSLYYRPQNNLVPPQNNFLPTLATEVPRSSACYFQAPETEYPHLRTNYSDWRTNYDWIV